ncbi:MAG: hypothetical protein LBR31_07405 [Desulfovibrio sp.]|nr:hypothetical protein [Desulfovibrio sp.]
MKLRFSLLSEDVGKADRRNFSCGSLELDSYLHRQVGQDAARGFATIVLARALENPSAIIGYYAFSTASVPLSVLPEESVRKCPVIGMFPPYSLADWLWPCRCKINTSDLSCSSTPFAVPAPTNWHGLSF